MKMYETLIIAALVLLLSAFAVVTSEKGEGIIPNPFFLGNPEPMPLWVAETLDGFQKTARPTFKVLNVPNRIVLAWFSDYPRGLRCRLIQHRAADGCVTDGYDNIELPEDACR